MGAGKTTIGRALARELEMRFLDSDHEIEARTGADIPWIFDIEGEEGFRRRERELIEELTALEGIVLATGGGAVLDPRNRDNLTQRGTVVYLCASVDRLLQRTAKDKSRPLLQTEDPRARLQTLNDVRDPLYREVADIVIETDRLGVRRAVELILERLGTRRGAHGVRHS